MKENPSSILKNPPFIKNTFCVKINKNNNTSETDPSKNLTFKNIPGQALMHQTSTALSSRGGEFIFNTIPGLFSIYNKNIFRSRCK